MGGGKVTGYRFGRVPEWLLDSDVSAQAIRLFALLTRYADHREGTGHARRKALAERMRCSVNTLDRTIQELVEVGAVEVVPHYAADGRRMENDYSLSEFAATPPHACSSPSPPAGTPLPTHGEGIARVAQEPDSESPTLIPLDSPPEGGSPKNGKGRWPAAWEIWNAERRGKQGAVAAVTPTREKHLAATLKLILRAAPDQEPLDVWRRMVQLFAADPFLNGTDPRSGGRAYGVDTLLRPEKRTKWIDAAVSGFASEQFHYTDPAEFGL